MARIPVRSCRLGALVSMLAALAAVGCSTTGGDRIPRVPTVTAPIATLPERVDVAPELAVATSCAQLVDAAQPKIREGFDGVVTAFGKLSDTDLATLDPEHVPAFRAYVSLSQQVQAQAGHLSCTERELQEALCGAVAEMPAPTDAGAGLLISLVQAGCPAG